MLPGENGFKISYQIGVLQEIYKSVALTIDGNMISVNSTSGGSLI